MKKILNLIGALTLIGTASTSVVACGSSWSSYTPDKSDNGPAALTAQGVIDKIVNPYIAVPMGTSTDVAQDTTILNNQLQKADHSLTNSDLSKLAYTGTLTPGTRVKITATATVDKASASTSIYVLLYPKPSPLVPATDTAQGIIDKIVNSKITLPVGTSTDVAQDTTILNDQLRKENKNLTKDNLLKLSYSGGPLIPGEKANPITVTATVDQIKASKEINVILLTPAGEIINKITNPNIGIYDFGNQDSTSAIAAQLKIKYYLQKANSLLTKDDLAAITVQNNVALSGKTAKVILTANIKGSSATKTVNVTIKGLASAKQVMSWITNTNLSISYPAVPGTYNPATDNPLIYGALFKANPIISPAQKSNIWVKGKKLVIGKPEQFQIWMLGPITQASKTIQVTLHGDTAADILAKITNKNIFISDWGINIDGKGSYTSKQIIPRLGTDLSDYDRSCISIQTGPNILKKIGNDKITINIVSGDTKANAWINVALQPSKYDNDNYIYDKNQDSSKKHDNFEYYLTSGWNDLKVWVGERYYVFDSTDDGALHGVGYAPGSVSGIPSRTTDHMTEDLEYYYNSHNAYRFQFATDDGLTKIFYPPRFPPQFDENMAGWESDAFSGYIGIYNKNPNWISAYENHGAFKMFYETWYKDVFHIGTECEFVYMKALLPAGS